MERNYNNLYHAQSACSGSCGGYDNGYRAGYSHQSAQAETVCVGGKEFPKVTKLSQEALMALRQLVSQNQCVIDESVLMLHHVELSNAFFSALYSVLQATRRSVIVVEETYYKLEHIALNHREAHKRDLAKNAMGWYHRLKTAGLLLQVDKYRFEDGRSYVLSAPTATILRLSEAMLLRREGENVVLITRSKDFADDVLALGAMNTAEKLRAEVYYVDVRGGVKPYQRKEMSAPRMPLPSAPPSGTKPPLRPQSRLTDLPVEQTNIGAMNAGMRLNADRGAVFTLEKRLGQGTEGMVYTVRETDRLVAKVFEKISRRKAEKIVRLCGMQIAGACMPVHVLRDQQNRICGYTMERIADGIALSDLFDNGTLHQKAPFWDRSNFVDAALQVVQIGRRLAEAGIVPTDGNLENIMIYRDPDGYYNRVAFIDVDSFQVDTARFRGKHDVGVIPGDGFTEEIMPLVDRMTTETIFSPEDYAYMLAIQAFMICMMGIHPFQAKPDARYADRSLSQLSQKGLFPYGTPDVPATIAEPLEDWKRLYQLMMPEAAALFAQTFSINSPRRAAQRGPELKELEEVMRRYNAWLVSRDTDERARELQPKEERPQAESVPVMRRANAQRMRLVMPWKKEA